MNIRDLKKIKILNSEYKIELIKSWDFKDCFYANVSYLTQTISISDNLTEDEALKALLHEIKHVFLRECGDAQILENNQLEKSCDQFASDVFCLFSENKEIIKKLLG